MSYLPVGYLARMQQTQTDHMFDTCRILAYASTPDSYNRPAVTYTAGPEVVCGFDPTPGREVQTEGQVVIVDAKLRLPAGTSFHSTDRIRITKRLGKAVPAQDYEIIGDGRHGPTGLVLDLKSVTE